MRVTGTSKLLSIDARGKFGRSGGFGRIAFGYNFFGFYSWYAGIYQKRYFYGEPYLSKSKFYRPTNPKTLVQMNWRYTYSWGIYLWQNLDLKTKKSYNKRALKKKMSGYNLFISEWLKYPTCGFGKIIFSHNAFGFY